jgi:acetyl-CoA carboxylase biotin carboxyl carrier protein
MSKPASSSGDIFDPERIRQLIELMHEHELGEIDLRDGSVRVRLRKHVEPMVTTVEARPAAPSAPAARSAAAPAAGAAPATDEKAAVIKSPMVGTFFSSASPEAAAFVKVGDHVGPETTVCIIEAMKVFNEIPAELSGQIVAVLVGNGEPVEFGQPLFKLSQSK